MADLILPRVLRHRDAPGYCGMDRNRFDAEVRPALTEIPIGHRGIAFDRLELDAWLDAYISERGRPSRARKGETPCELGQKGSSPSGATGPSTSSTSGNGYSNVSARPRKTTQKPGFVRYHAFDAEHLKNAQDEVTDHLLVQKVLVKLRGAERQRPLLTSLDKACTGLPRAQAYVRKLLGDLDDFGSFQAMR